MTKHTPILFRDELVRAILAGRKTVTRRPVKPQPAYPGIDHYELELDPWHADAFKGTPAEGRAGSTGPRRKVWMAYDWCGNPVGDMRTCPYGAPGDLLWVREAWCHETPAGWPEKDCFPGCKRLDHIRHRATESYPESLVWKPSIHMPRWACRLWLRVTEVSVERLQDITAEEVRAEGFRQVEASDFEIVQFFRAGWDALYAAKPELQWDANPWLWVVHFERTEAP